MEFKEWVHRSCFDKNERFKLLGSLFDQQKFKNINDRGFDWDTKESFIK